MERVHERECNMRNGIEDEERGGSEGLRRPVIIQTATSEV